MRFERSVPDLLRDIVESIDDITDFIGSMDYGAYVDSRITCAAVERKLMIVSEAAVRLGRGIEAACPTQDGRAIRGIGNVMRHHYEGVDDEVVWDAVHTKLPGLRRDVRAMLATYED